MRKHLKKILIGLGIVLLAFVGWLLLRRSGSSIDVNNPKASAKPTEAPKTGIAPLSGLACTNAERRPFAVMLASDPEARPLRGLGEADMVFEMPVTETGVTRMMAVFQCNDPKEFGSIRSARLDFIPFVQGLTALYMHWGGEHEALDELNHGIVDNVDCLKYDGSSCLRKSSIPRPHNGFSTPALLLAKAKALGYNFSLPLVSYPHGTDKSKGQASPPALYGGDFKVAWTYEPTTNSYLRFRANTKEVDFNTGKQVSAKNIIVMHTTSEYVSILYNRVKTVGSGTIEFYANGELTVGTWQKTSASAKLTFIDAQKKEIAFTPGSTWIEIATP